MKHKMSSMVTGSASNRTKLLRFLKPKTPTSRLHSILVHHLSTQPTFETTLQPEQSQPQPNGHDSAITQIVRLLEVPENEWNSTELNNLLFATDPFSPRIFFQITHRLGSSSKALKFFDYVRANSPAELDAGSLSSTFQAIFELASREPTSQNVLFDLYRTSKEKNVPLTVNVATRLIQCFGRAGMVDEALSVFNDLDPSFKNVYVRNLIIGFLLRKGLVDIALQVLDEMLQPDAEFPPNDYTGDIVFNEFFRRERTGRGIGEEDLAGLVLKFAEHGVLLDTMKLTILVAKLCRNGKQNRAWDVLNDVMKLGGPVEAASCNALLAALGKERNFDRMNVLMAKMKEMDIQPSVVTFGILINHLCKFRRVDEALEVFGKMGGEGEARSVLPDVITYNTLINGLCKVGRQEEGLDLMKKMRSQNGCSPNTATYNCLIDGFSKAGNIETAHELFDQMNNEGVVPNVITLNTLVDGMCNHGRISSAVELFNAMQKKGLKGNAVTYTTLINAFCKVNNIDKAMKFFDEMVNSNCSLDAIAYYTLIAGLTQAGRLRDASLVMSKLKEAGFVPDLVCYNNLIGGFCKKNKLDEAYEMLKEMEQNGVKPDSVTYNILISYFAKVGDFKYVHRMMKKMTDEGLVLTVVTYGALIHAYCLNGKTDEAMEIFNQMSVSSKVSPNTVIYNILIDSLCKKGEGEVSFSLLDDMKVKGVKPNTATFNAIFKGLREKNLLEKAYELMDEMVEHSCHPDYITMETLTEWLSAVGETKKLRKFVQGYKVSASSI